jgi:hypothetical protein
MRLAALTPATPPMITARVSLFANMLTVHERFKSLQERYLSERYCLVGL